VGLAVASLMFVLAVVGLAQFGPNLRLRPSRRSPAYNLYLRARAFEVQPNVSGIESSLDLFQQAILKDSEFAPAYAGMAAAYAARSGFDGFDATERAEMIAKGQAAARKALQLDARSADAHDGLGMVQAREAQWQPAERSFRRAIELAPRDVLWRDHFALFLLLPLGRIDEAIGQLRIAEELDPLSAQTHSALSSALRSAHRFDEALFHCQKAAQNDQQRSVCWAQNLLRQAKNEEAVRILEASWTGHLLEPGGHVLGIAYAKAGRRDDAERIAAMLPRLASRAQIFAALEDKERTLEMLDRMTPMGPARIGRDFLISPNFAFLSGDPRLPALRKKVGLPE
jgi:tetratricopeptide (TPR) repeat protein